jgi:hypothetical protein
MDRNWVVLGVSLLVWGLLFVWILRVEKRLDDMEK